MDVDFSCNDHLRISSQRIFFLAAGLIISPLFLESTSEQHDKSRHQDSTVAMRQAMKARGKVKGLPAGGVAGVGRKVGPTLLFVIMTLFDKIRPDS